MKGGGLTMELAERKAQCHLCTACVKQASATASNSAGRRWISDAKARFCSIGIITVLFRWDQVLELCTVPPGFLKVLLIRTSYSSSASYSGLPGLFSNLLSLQMGFCLHGPVWGWGLLCCTPKEGSSFLCQNGSSSLDLSQAWVILWKHKSAPYERSLVAALVLGF